MAASFGKSLECPHNQIGVPTCLPITSRPRGMFRNHGRNKADGHFVECSKHQRRSRETGRYRYLATLRGDITGGPCMIPPAMDQSEGPGCATDQGFKCEFIATG